MEQNNRNSPRAVVSMVLLLILAIAAAWLLPKPLGSLVFSAGGGLALTWLIVALLMAFILILIGESLGKGAAGILIDPARNMMSLSRLQVVLWTWVILSALLTVAVARVGDSLGNPAGYTCPPASAGEEPSCADPLGIQLPALVWALLGISITSAVGAPLLKANKAQRTAEEDHQRLRAARLRSRREGGTEEAASYAQALQNRIAENPDLQGQVENTGALVRKTSWTLARFSDIFSGEEISNFMYVDIAKVQNFFFTIIAVVAYTVALVAAMVQAGSVAGFFAFPDPGPGLAALISISHAGYLTDKAFAHSTPETANGDGRGGAPDEGSRAAPLAQFPYEEPVED